MDGLSTKEAHEVIKKTMQACNGHVMQAAELLGMPYRTLSRRLNTGKLLLWWTSFKKRQIEKNRKERGRRSYHRRKVRALLEAGYDLETAETIASTPRPRGRFHARPPTPPPGRLPRP
jgi:hypothetical protein